MRFSALPKTPEPRKSRLRFDARWRQRKLPRQNTLLPMSPQASGCWVRPTTLVKDVKEQYENDPTIKEDFNKSVDLGRKVARAARFLRFLR